MKRQGDAAEDHAAAEKKQKAKPGGKTKQATPTERMSAMIERVMARTLVCPITLQLPHDPVQTPQGQVYEKGALLLWLKTKETDPITNERLTVDDLRPARWARDQIETYLSTPGVSVSPSLTENWKKMKAAAEKVEALKKKAREGSGEACHKLGHLMLNGKLFLNDEIDATANVDAKKAEEWFAMGSLKAHPGCMHEMGVIELGRKNFVPAVYFLTQASRAVPESLYALGQGFASGSMGLPKDEAQAKVLLEKVCSWKGYVSVNTKRRAEEYLTSILNAERLRT